MSKTNGRVDQTLINEVHDLETTPVNSHQAQQLNQDRNDRRHITSENRDKNTDMDPSHK
ncbi:hypothetical protein [Paenibacillus physcomitrellae]|uniref:DUF4025 domain-containing protein n=1 Tax=Paenibacillus physcomitrellae TaxID=1619311 RepID=A0ABQ1FXX9_9BACL|nr:hypothetical protein [Paenibacillus physcomitrellae]GGA32651.1 hypothetical protein GCM10010917_17210 [Paenibacillus physcomitrellae]